MIVGVDSTALGQTDAGNDRDTRDRKPCCERMRCGGHCVLADGHGGYHMCPKPRALPASDFGPRRKTP